MANHLPMASPSTRILASKSNINLREVATSMQTEFVHAGDLHQSGSTGPITPDRETLGAGSAEPMTRVAQITATNLCASQQIPAVTHDDAVETTQTDNLRHLLRTDQSIKVSSLAFHVMALARTLCEFPRFNASLIDNGENLWVKDNVNIGIAVDTPHGLMVPVIENADRLGLSAITETISTLAEAARIRKLKPSRMQGAGMSISNLGGLGGRAFTPMINPPELAILGIMQTRMEPVWDGEQFVPLPMCPLSLTYDHRVINGADAQRFLNHYKGLLSSPGRLLF